MACLWFLTQIISFILIPIKLDLDSISWFSVFIPHWISLLFVLAGSFYERLKKPLTQQKPKFSGIEIVIVLALIVGMELIIAAKLQGIITTSWWLVLLPLWLYLIIAIGFGLLTRRYTAVILVLIFACILSLIILIMKYEGPLQEIGFWETSIPIETALWIISGIWLKKSLWPSDVDDRKDYEKSFKIFKEDLLLKKVTEKILHKDELNDLDLNLEDSDSD